MNIKTFDWSAYKGDIPGYGDCRAVPGEYACLFPDRYVESSFSGQTGRAALLNGENINYLRIPHAKGDGRMAGGGQTTKPDPVYEWQWPAGWVKVGLMYGPNGVIYGAGDVLTAVTSQAQYQATAGWRYVNEAGVLVNCESTRQDVARGLYEYTEWADVAIGQGGKPDMGAVVLFPGEKLRRLDPRPEGQRPYPFNARFIRSDRNGDQFGIAIVDLTGRKTYFVWATLAELRALPFVGTVPPIEPPIPPVEPPVTDYLGVNKRVRAKYPLANPGGAPLGADHWVYLVDLAQQTGTLLFQKDGGDHVFVPPLGKNVSLDVVGRGSLGDNWADVLGDAEGQAVPTWDQHPNAAGTYLDVSGIALPGEPQPPIEPPTGNLEQRVEALEAAMAAIHRSTAGWL